jgi:hypothetical protein
MPVSARLNVALAASLLFFVPAVARGQGAEASFPVEPTPTPPPPAATPPAAVTPPPVAPRPVAPTAATPSPIRAPAATNPPQATREPPLAPDPASAELERIDALISHYDRNFKQYQLWGSVTFLASAAVTIPAGIALMNRSANNVAGAAVLGLGVGEAVGALVLMIGSSGEDTDFVALADAVNAARQSGDPPWEQLARIEAAWKKRAAEAHASRQIAGVSGLALGVAGLAGGTYLALAHLESFSKNAQYGAAAACYGLSALGFGLGVRSFFFEAPSETAWRTYQAGRGVRSAKLSVGAVPGGAELELHASF